MLKTLKIAFKNKDEIKTFSYIQKQKKFISSRHIKGMSKEVPSDRRKMMTSGNFCLQNRNNSHTTCKMPL